MFSKEYLDKSEELAFWLGMFVGDGCLSKKHNGQGYRVYPINFYNTDKVLIDLFEQLFHEIFGLKGNIYLRKRNGKKDIWIFEKYSVKIYSYINKEFNIPHGKKAISVGIPNYILIGENNIKKAFLKGLLVTDGCIRKKKDIIFHSASLNLTKDLQNLFFSVWKFNRSYKEYCQLGKYKSYQITLNKSESSRVLFDLAVVAQPGTAQILTFG